VVVASTIGWALHLTGRDDLPAISDGASEMAVLDWAPTHWSPVRGVVKGIRLRSDEVLATERERWDVLYWRSTLFDGLEYLEEDQQAWSEAIPEIVEANLWPIKDGDLLVGDNTTFANVEGDDLVELQENAEVRLRTLNWVCGYGDRPTTARWISTASSPANPYDACEPVQTGTIREPDRQTIESTRGLSDRRFRRHYSRRRPLA
jgi:hypothetical protein